MGRNRGYEFLCRQCNRKVYGVSGPGFLPALLVLVSMLLAKFVSITAAGIFMAIVSVLGFVWCMKDLVTKKKREAEYAQYLEEKENIRKLFLRRYNVPKVLEIAKDVQLHRPAVAVNRYEHSLSTSDESKWGVYVGSYFLPCSCTADTFKCVELLREAGVDIAKDERCLYEKK